MSDIIYKNRFTFGFQNSDFKNLLNTITALGFAITRQNFKELDYSTPCTGYHIFSKISSETGLNFTLIEKDNMMLYSLKNEYIEILVTKNEYILTINSDFYNSTFNAKHNVFENYNILDASINKFGFTRGRADYDIFRAIRLCAETRKSLFMNGFTKNPDIPLQEVWEMFFKTKMDWTIR